MHWTRAKRGGRLAPLAALLLAAACGGGDKGPTGPGGGGLTGPYDPVGLNGNRLPAVTHVEDCMATQVTEGGLTLDPDGTWRMDLRFNDADGTVQYDDHGWYDDEGGTVWLDSGYSGATYEASVDGHGIRVMYDLCFDGTPDVEFDFAR